MEQGWRSARPTRVATVSELGGAPRPLAPGLGPGSRVVVVTGSYGAGHDAAAREIALRLRGIGCAVDTYDVVDLLPARTGRLLKVAYLAQLRHLPGSWEVTLRRLQPGSRTYRLTRQLVGLAGHRLLRAAADADLVVSTHPFASQALGRLRVDGDLRCPVVTYLTDASVHPLWVHPGVDLHLAQHDVAADEARRWGGRTRVVEPLVPVPARRTSVDRRDLGLPEGRPLAVLVGGSLGIGELEEAAIDLLGTGRVTPIVACGRNERLRERLDARPGIVALGWRDDLPDLFAVASVVVQNAGGFMSLEAMASGVPLLSYRPVPGHGRANAEALERAGLVPFVRRPGELPAAVDHALTAAASRLPSGAPDLVAVLTGAAERVPAGVA
jgi:processive 1,2-diacylglycerol beta-glucosyltransferase